MRGSSETSIIDNCVTCEWRYDGQLAIIRPHDTRPNTVDVWVDAVLAIAFEWPAAQPCIVLHDLSSKNASLTDNYVKERVKHVIAALSDKRPDLQGRIGILLQESLPMLLFKPVLEGAINRKLNGNGLHYRVFTNRNPALDWLQDGLPQKQG